MGSTQPAWILAVLAMLMAVAPLTAAAGEGRARLQAYLDEVRTWRAEFEQTVRDEAGKMLERARGEVYVARPGRFRWDYTSPYAQSIVADGDTVWVYDADLEQVTRRPLDADAGGTPALLLGKDVDLDARFEVAELGRRGAMLWVELAPRGEDEPYERIRVGFEGETLAAMDLADSLGQHTLIKFSDVRRNPPLDPSLFRFTPPPGVDVVEGAP